MIMQSNAVTNDVFSTINSFVLGDVVQSMSILMAGYICVNNSAKIEVY